MCYPRLAYSTVASCSGRIRRYNTAEFDLGFPKPVILPRHPTTMPVRLPHLAHGRLTNGQLIILSGYPCSGLTHRAHQLADSFSKTQDELLSSDPPTLKTRYKIHIVPTHDSSHPRTIYDHARTEKETRGVAYTRARRALGKDSIVILDGMNYIKGYRYQLWCEAKALGTTSCVVGG